MASVKYKNVYILDSYSIAGKNEIKGSIKSYDRVIDDYYFETNTFEDAEVKMQTVAVDSLIKINKI